MNTAFSSRLGRLMVIALLASSAACAADHSGDDLPDDRAKSEPEGPAVLSEQDSVRRQNAEAERAAGLVYTLGIEEGHAIKFFRDPEGGAFVSEEMRADQQLVLANLGEVTAVDVFKMYRPEAEVPQELRDFELFGAVNAKGDEASAESPIAPDELEPQSALLPKHASSSGPHFEFDHKFCPTALGWNTTSRVCWLVRAGNGFATASSTTHTQGFMSAWNGNSLFTYLRNGKSMLSVTVLQGEVRWIAGMGEVFRNCNWLGDCGYWQVRRSTLSFDLRGGAGFHFGAAWADMHTNTQLAYAATN